MIQAEVVAHSVNTFGNVIATLAITFPRMILAEFNTHRMFSRNSASSRAIPFKRAMETAIKNPFIPLAWQKDHSGMQGIEYLETGTFAKADWLRARDKAVNFAVGLNERCNVTKQLCNRLLEPFQWHKVLVTATSWENFFVQRCPQFEFEYKDHHGDDLTTGAYRSRKELIEHIEDCDTDSEVHREFGKSIYNFELLDWLKINKGGAEIHMMLLAEAMYDALKASTPKLLQPGEWHMPYGDNIDEEKLHEIVFKNHIGNPYEHFSDFKVKIATARCARTSYNNFGEKVFDFTKDIDLHDNKLVKLLHMSPLEHCAQAMSEGDYDDYLVIEDGEVFSGACRNFQGWIQHRVRVERDLAIYNRFVTRGLP